MSGPIDATSISGMGDRQVVSIRDLAVEEANSLELWGRLLNAPNGAVLLERVKERREAVRDLYGKINVMEPGAVNLLASFQGREEELTAIFAGRDPAKMKAREKELAQSIGMCNVEIENRNRIRLERKARGNGIVYEEPKDG